MPLRSAGGVEGQDTKRGTVLVRERENVRIQPPPPMARNGREGKRRKAQVASLQTEKKELTCTMRVQGSPVRALVDTGESLSLIRTDANDKLWIGGRLRKPDVMLSQASGKKLLMTGMVSLPLRIGGVRCKHKLYVVSKLCNQMILGEDWLKGWKDELKFDPPHTHRQ